MAKWSRATYEVVAEGIRQQVETEETSPAIIERSFSNLAHYFVGAFTSDNHAFDSERFLTACGLNSKGEREIG